MKKLGWVLGWLAATVVLSAVLTPVAVWVVEMVAPGQVPVRRVFNRCLLGSALLLGWPFLRQLGIRGWREVGWSGPMVRGLRGFGVAFAAGLVLLGLLYFGAVGLGGRVWGTWPGWGWVGWSLLFAVLVGVVEETVFRGVLFLALVRGGAALVPVVVVNAVLFASVHFFKAPEMEEMVTWRTGFEIWGGMLTGGWAEGEAVWRWGTLAFLGLTMTGLVRRTGTIWLAAGAHAGLVLAMKLMLGLTVWVPGGVGMGWGSDGISGPLPLALAVGAAVWSWTGGRR